MTTRNTAHLFITTLSLLIAVGNASPAQANCNDAYNNAAKRLDGMLNPTRTTMITAAASGAAIPIAVSATTGVFVAASLVAFPAALLSAGTFFAITKARMHSFQKVLQLLKNSDLGKGAILAKATASIQSSLPDASEQQVAEAIKKMNQKNMFCVEDDLGKPKLMGFKKVLRAIRNNMTDQPVIEAADAAALSEDSLGEDEIVGESDAV